MFLICIFIKKTTSYLYREKAYPAVQGNHLVNYSEDRFLTMKIIHCYFSAKSYIHGMQYYKG